MNLKMNFIFDSDSARFKFKPDDNLVYNEKYLCK